MANYDRQFNHHMEKKVDIGWCQDKISCPRCGGNISLDRDVNICGQCQLGFQMDRNVICWDNFDLQVNSIKNWKRYYEGIKFILDPMTSPFSPLSAWTRYLVDNYYDRILWDKNLAEKWQQHYLEGLNIETGDSVLDHGCGRGRNIGLLNLLGFNVAGQEIETNKWWDNLPQSLVQVVSPSYPRLPWKDHSFSLIMDVGVIGHFRADLLEEYCKEVYRVLEPGGYWLILEANSEGYGAWMPRKHYGRLHSLKEVKSMVASNGFKEIDYSYEGFYAPIFPRFINFLRKQHNPNSFDMYDYDSKIEKHTPENKRGLWLLRLQKENFK